MIPEVCITNEDLDDLVYDWADAGLSYLIALCQHPSGSQEEREALSRMEAAKANVLSEALYENRIGQEESATLRS